MAQVQLREDPMSRIQREIIEVTEREREFREGHFRKNGDMTPDKTERTPREVHTPREAHTPRELHTSTPQMCPDNSPATSAILNGHAYKRATMHSATKGLMQRFIANKGRMTTSPPFNTASSYSPPFSMPYSPIPAPTAITVPLEAVQNPIKKRRQPVKEKIANELKEMRDREYELKRMRKKRNSFDSDLSSESELEEEEEECDGTIGISSSSSLLGPARSIGSLLYSDSPGSGRESGDSPKPARSLAELCELPPGQEFLADSSSKLIAMWESLTKRDSTGKQNHHN